MLCAALTPSRSLSGLLGRQSHATGGAAALSAGSRGISPCQIRSAPVEKADLATSLESLDALLTSDEDTPQQQGTPPHEVTNTLMRPAEAGMAAVDQEGQRCW